MLECLVERAVAAIVRQDGQRDRAHRAVAAGASLALQERRHSARRLVLDDGTDERIVESDLERRSRNHDIGRLIDAGVLRGGATDDQATIERMADVLADPPTLALDVANRGIGSGTANI